jgi:hypothetical protein
VAQFMAAFLTTLPFKQSGWYLNSNAKLMKNITETEKYKIDINGILWKIKQRLCTCLKIQ